MAKFIARARFDIEAFLINSSLGDFFDSATVTGGSSRLVFTYSLNGVTEQLILNGTFGNFVNGVPTTGTITRAEYSITGGDSFVITGISMSVGEFTGYVQAGDASGLFVSLFAGSDSVIGSDQDDVLAGFAGNDVIDGRAGADRMGGLTGDDRYLVDNVGDVVLEAANEGKDMVVSTISYTLPDEVEALQLTGAAVTGTGNTGANQLFGSAFDNTLRGLGGDDVLRGNGGRDTLVGGFGRDTLDGGGGKDTLTGNQGADYFQFRDGDMNATRFSADLITDFSQAELDKIQLAQVDANTTLDGNQAFAFIGAEAFSGSAGQLRYAQANGTTYIEGDTNGDAVADFVIAVTGTVDLVATDFWL